MTRDKLMFNDGKTEIILVGTSQQLKKVGINTMKICNIEITPVDVVRDLGVWLDSRLRMTLMLLRFAVLPFIISITSDELGNF